MEPLRRVWALILATVIMWLSIAILGEVSSSELVNGVAAIFAVIGTITLWTLWALDYYGISVDGSGDTTRQKAIHEKPKRDTDDDRVALLFSLLTPDERDAVRARLVDDLNGDGEIVSLADLIATQQDRTHREEA